MTTTTPIEHLHLVINSSTREIETYDAEIAELQPKHDDLLSRIRKEWNADRYAKMRKAYWTLNERLTRLRGRRSSSIVRKRNAERELRKRRVTVAEIAM